MTMILFSALNVAGVVFLLYVLVQFWREGHKATHEGRRGLGLVSRYRYAPEVMLLRYFPLPEAGGTARTLIPFPAERTRARVIKEGKESKVLPEKRYSTP